MPPRTVHRFRIRHLAFHQKRTSDVPQKPDNLKSYRQLFDGVIDFDKATLDPATGEVKVEFQPNSSTGGPGDKLHPNRAGYAAMANAIDLGMVTGRAK
jgi:lysophospholipase L1-like esterase